MVGARTVSRLRASRLVGETVRMAEGAGVTETADDRVGWPAGTATGIGSLPGTNPVEAARIVVGELPDLPHLPELPARGVGADLIGRTAGLLVDLAVDVVPSGYRTVQRPGREHRRAVDLLRTDLDALDEVLATTGARPELIKLQVCGPWTLTAGIELTTGHKVLTDRGALREFTESLAEGLRLHVAEVARRTGARIVVQLDEPSVPAVLDGTLRTPSGYGNVSAVHPNDVQTTLARIVDVATESTGGPVIVHCCAPRPPVALFRRAGASAVALDTALLSGAPTELWDELGESWDAGLILLLGLIPSLDPGRPVKVSDLGRPALEMADRLGFARTSLATRAVPTPSCGLAGARPDWARRALTLARELGTMLREPPERG